MKKNNYTYEKNWECLIDDIVESILKLDNNNIKETINVVTKITANFYILFITNISTKEIIRRLMIKLLLNLDNIKLKLRLIEITSIFELRIAQERDMLSFGGIHNKNYYLFYKHKMVVIIITTDNLEI